MYICHLLHAGHCANNISNRKFEIDLVLKMLTVCWNVRDSLLLKTKSINLLETSRLDLESTRNWFLLIMWGVGSSSFFSLWMFNWSHAVYWKGCSFPTALHGKLHHISSVYMHGSVSRFCFIFLFLDFIFCFINLFVYPCMSTTLSWKCSLISNRTSLPLLVPLQETILSSLHINIKF